MKDIATFIFDGSESVKDDYLYPKRATAGSAGYDFFATEDIEIPPNDCVLINTHTKVKFEKDGWFLGCFPRSGLGFKYRVSLANTVGIIDADYYSDEKGKGVIMCKLFNPHKWMSVHIEKGKAYMQTIFIPFGTVVGDHTDGVRNGEGFGSTDNNK